MKPTEMPVVQTAGLTKVFKDFWKRDRVIAVDSLNFEVRRGEVFGLLGPNGSGKSTTIKMLLGLLYPTRGRISVFGKPPTDVAVKARIGFLPEESFLYRFLNARETLDLYGRLFKQHSRQRHERIEKLLDMVGLTAEATRRIGEYSKGMARRIGLAQALINDPEFLILDEPTAGLDPIGIRQIKDVIRELSDKGKTILLSSHLLADVEDVCDRISILYGGRERSTGTIGDLLSHEDRTQITTDKLTPETVEKVRTLLHDSAGKKILNVGAPSDRLETYFLQIIEQAEKTNARSSGARRSGALPDFLGKTAPPNLVENLVSAADRKPAPSPAELLEIRPREDVRAKSKAVIENLTQPKPAAPEPPETQPPVVPRERRAPEADRSIIDALVDKKKDDGDG